MIGRLEHDEHHKKSGSNHRNGYNKKTVISDDGELELILAKILGRTTLPYSQLKITSNSVAKFYNKPTYCTFRVLERHCPFF
ncbi:hypothetical protein [Gilliamella sp. Fer1-1]|uniref:hypothetical protein n=1 Tax=Gilliamella sp. Fer1-1 TaxID=3120240 RepID=UPI0011477B77|nr:hypothetical protein [Gilliamella apicola]